MNPLYAAWIEGYLSMRVASLNIVGGDGLTDEDIVSIAARGWCGAATEDMVKDFPELIRVRGHYGGIQHWWCKTADGEIVDPTAAQFTPGHEYIEYDGPDPVGKCMECGELVWSMEFSSSACSKECLMALEQEYGSLRNT